MFSLARAQRTGEEILDRALVLRSLPADIWVRRRSRAN